MATRSSRSLAVDDVAFVHRHEKPETEELIANGRGRSPDIPLAVFVDGGCRKKAEVENSTENGSGRSPEVDAVALIGKPERETSDGDQSAKERKRRRRRRTYGRLKRIRREALALPVGDVATESGSEKRFVVVDGGRVAIFRSPTLSTSSTAAADNNRRSWLDRKLPDRKRKSAAPSREAETSKSKSEPTTTTIATTSKRRCQRYLKQFVAALFSTVGLLCLMVGYTVLGGFMFSRLECSNELSVKDDMRQVNSLRY